MKPIDSEWRNGQRSACAANVLDTFRKLTGSDSGEESLCDLLADLRHWTDETGVCWETALAGAMQHYHREVEEEVEISAVKKG